MNRMDSPDIADVMGGAEVEIKKYTSDENAQEGNSG